MVVQQSQDLVALLLASHQRSGGRDDRSVADWGEGGLGGSNEGPGGDLLLEPAQVDAGIQAGLLDEQSPVGSAHRHRRPTAPRRPGLACGAGCSVRRAAGHGSQRRLRGDTAIPGAEPGLHHLVVQVQVQLGQRDRLDRKGRDF